MNETTLMLSAPAVAMFIFLVMKIAFLMKVQRSDRTYYRQQIDRLVEENQQYHKLFLRMIDKRLDVTANKVKTV